jgi:hypothetical protein
MSEREQPTGERGYAVVRVSKDQQDRRSQMEKIQRWLEG